MTGKRRLLETLKYLWENGSEEDCVTAEQIRRHLAGLSYDEDDVSLPTIYNDILEINEGLEGFIKIVPSRGRGNSGYAVTERLFKLSELKILLDCVQSAHFIPVDKTVELIKKLESLTGVKQGRALHRDVSYINSIKTKDETIFETVEKLKELMDGANAIKFTYNIYNGKKQLVPKTSSERPDGAYTVTPRGLMVQDEYYYLLGYDHTKDRLSHFRVDKISNVTDAGIKRSKSDKLQLTNDLSAYGKKLFGMFSGEPIQVKLWFKKELIGVAIDFLGDDIMFIPQDDGGYNVTTEIIDGDQFYGWIFGLGSGVKIISPQKSIDRMVSYAESVLEIYGRA